MNPDGFVRNQPWLHLRCISGIWLARLSKYSLVSRQNIEPVTPWIRSWVVPSQYLTLHKSRYFLPHMITCLLWSTVSPQECRTRTLNLRRDSGAICCPRSTCHERYHSVEKEDKMQEDITRVSMESFCKTCLQLMNSIYFYTNLFSKDIKKTLVYAKGDAHDDLSFIRRAGRRLAVIFSFQEEINLRQCRSMFCCF